MPDRILKCVLYGSTSVLAVAMANTLGAGVALAQQAPATSPPGAPAAPAPAEGSLVGEIIVTGSRLATSPFTSPTPVNVIGATQLTNRPVATIADALNQLPSFRPNTTPATNFFALRNTIAARTLDLRGLGQQRTLVLIDGQRFVASNDLDTLDLNEIPSNVIARAEVVTGGASAAYGADAVAGVVNMIIDTKMKGIKAEASYGVSGHGDGRNYNLSFAAGSDVFGGRGHFMVGGEYLQENGLGDCFSRDWCAKETNYVPNPGWPGNGLPATIVTNNTLFVMNPGGVIPTGPLAGNTFDKNGNLTKFTFGQFYSGTFMVGGDPSVQRAYLIENQPLSAPDKHFAALGNFTYDLTSRIQGSVMVNYAETTGGPVDSADAFDTPQNIKIDNAYLQPAVRQLMIANNLTSIPVNRYSVEAGPQNHGSSFNKTWRIVAGLKGDIVGDWKWDATYQYGRTDGRLTVLNIRQTARWNQSIDAVVNPASGQIVCRSTLTNPNDGCVPMDYLGPGNISQAALGWTQANSWQSRKYTLQSISANVHGTLFEGWAGPITAAAGGEYREQRYRGAADTLSVLGLLTGQNTIPLPSGGQNVTEGYLEASAPLVRDVSLIQSFNVDAAVRQTHYSRSGNATTWKVGGVWHVNSDIMFRATRSRDIRAPTAQEQSPVASGVILPLTDPVLRQNYLLQTYTTGNQNLQLEKADTTTIGGVLSPGFIRGLRLSVDYYNIKMNNAIDTIAAQATINLCAAGNAQVCNFVQRGANGQIVSVTSTYQNLSSLHASGYEAVLNYGADLDGLGLKGRMDLTVNGNYVNDLSVVSATGAKVQNVNWTGNPGSVLSIPGVPRWRVDASATYSNGPLTATVSGRYIPRALLDPSKIGPGEDGYSQTLSNSISNNYIDSRLYVDLAARWMFKNVSGTDVELFGSIANIFDKDPPATLRLVGNPLYFDQIGRAFKIGVRIRR